MDFREDTPVEVNCIYIFQTEDAVKIQDAEGREVWLPKQQVSIDTNWDRVDFGDDITLTIGEQLAVKKGLV